VTDCFPGDVFSSSQIGFFYAGDQMEALEPVLKQKFWILLGTGILMTFIGWWMATGAMATQTAERKTKIKAAEDSIPKGEVPNESWTKRLAAINAVQDSSINVTKMSLWKRQQQRMVIPQELDQTVALMGKFSNEDREVFRDIYTEEVRKVWKMLNPMDIDGSGVVNFSLAAMGKVMNQKPWPNAAPKSEVIWDILEDLWLLEGLFKSIADVNGGPNATRMEAVVHQIDKLELRGGGDKLPASGGAGGSALSGGEGMMGGMGMGMGMALANRGGGGATGGLGGSLPAVSAEFDVREEFGDDGSGASTGAAAGGGRSGMAMSSMMMMGAEGGMGGGGTPTAETVVKRYVSDDQSRPFKTRGFYLSVKMDHRRIPQLIAELTANEKSVWPIEILRVQMSRLHEDDATFAGGGSSGPMAAAGGMGMQMQAKMAMSMRPSAGADEGLSSAMLGMSGAAGGAEEFPAFSTAGTLGGGATKSPQAIAAQSVLENTLKDPYMAQVTLCGVFTMYRKVEEPEKPAVTPQTGEVPPTAELNGVEGDGVSGNGAPTDGDNSTPAVDGAQEPGDDQKPADEAMETGDPVESANDPAGNPENSNDKPAAKTDEEKPDETPKEETDLK
jgi:hypothetical protein